MKKRSLLLVSLLFILFFVRCTEETVEPPVPVNSMYTINITQSGVGGTVSPVGILQVAKGNLSLTIKKDIGIKVLVNGVETSENPINLNVNSDLKADITFEKTTKWQLAKHPWYYFSREVRNLSDNKYLYTAYVPKDLKYEKLIFDEDSIRGYNISGAQVHVNPYKLIDATTINQGTDFKLKIIEISDDKFVYSYLSPFYEVFPIVKRIPEKDQLVIETYKK